LPQNAAIAKLPDIFVKIHWLYLPLLALAMPVPFYFDFYIAKILFQKYNLRYGHQDKFAGHGPAPYIIID
jgi:hypothetical protein